MVRISTSIMLAALTSSVLALPPNAAEVSSNREHLDGSVTKDDSNQPKDTGKGGAVVYSGCDQGDCPDKHRGFDHMWVGRIVDGYWQHEDMIRVGDCGVCMSRVVGTGGGGCWDFNSCGRDQQICVDTGHSRAHRLWKDVGHKECYGMEYENLGSCPGTNKLVNYLYSPYRVDCTW